MEGQNPYLGGTIFVFVIFSKQTFLGTRKFGGKQKKFAGTLPPKSTPWLRAWGNLFTRNLTILMVFLLSLFLWLVILTTLVRLEYDLYEHFLAINRETNLG